MAKTRLQQLIILLQKMPNDQFLNYALAMEYISLDEYQKATDVLTVLLENDPNYLACYYQLAKLLEQTNKDVLFAEVDKSELYRKILNQK